MRPLLLASLVVLVSVLAATSCSDGGGGNGNVPPPGTVADAGGGAPDAGVALDAGTAPPDAGAALDAGTAPDAGSDLPPIKPECANGQGTEDCWGEWLKETQQVQFTPIARGQLGAGPWPTTEVVTMGGGQGIGVNVQYAGVDSAQNVWAVSREALFVRRAGAAQFERYDRNTNGLRDYPFLSVAGAGPNVAYVGLEGVFGTDENNEPAAVRKSGDMMRVELVPGGIQVKTYDTHNSNTPLSGKYDHSRSIFELIVPKRGPAAGEVFLGTEHGLVRYTGDLYVDHRHIATMVPNGDGTTSERFGGTHAMAVLDDGTVWYGNDFRFGGLPWTPRRYEWYFDAKWLFPSNGFGGTEDRDYYEGIGVDSKGGVWAGARTFGIAHLAISGRRGDIERISVPDSKIRDLVVDLDDTIWLATDGGLYRADSSGKSWQMSTFVSGTVNDIFLDDTVSPRALYFSTRSGLTVYRGQ